MKTKIEYKGPSIHRRMLSRADLTAAGIEFPEGVEFKTMVFEPGAARRAVVLDEDVPASLQKDIVDILSKDKAFTISDGGEVLSEADPDAGHINADGSDVNGAGGSELLKKSIEGDAPKAGKSRSNG